MDIEAFLDNLHFDVEKVFPENWEADWEDAPLPFKLYRNLPEIPLSAEIPFSFKNGGERNEPDLKKIGNFLWYVFGVTQYAQTALSGGKQEDAAAVVPALRRFVPSGGALYPNELYLYLKLPDLPEGIYHYSSAHHRLVLLREGNFDSYISGCLGNRYDIGRCFGIVFVSTAFWKNFYKYHNFSYRLQGLDTGALIGQTLMAAKEMEFSNLVCFQFLDRAINHLLGISSENESVYAVIPLSSHSNFAMEENLPSLSAEQLCHELPALEHDTYERSKKIIAFPMLLKVNEASMMEKTDTFGKRTCRELPEALPGLETIFLPDAEGLSYEFAELCRMRRSPDADFFLEKVDLTQVSELLKDTASFEYQDDLNDAFCEAKSGLAIYGSFYQTENIPDGLYRYDKKSHFLQRIAFGDHRSDLQAGLTFQNVNLFQTPLCFHVVGEKDAFRREFGYRGYRIQQMETGILVQKLLLMAQSLGMGGHPLLGFDVQTCDRLYQIDSKENTCLIQLPVGSYHPRAWLTGSLHG